MRVRIRNRYDDKYSITVNLPAEPLKLYDMLDRIGADNRYCNVYMNIEDECIPEAMRVGGFYDDIFKLNLLAQRLEAMTSAYKAGFTAVLQEHGDYNLDGLILVTYGLDVYPIYPCRDYSELGEIVIENDMIEEAEECPDELIPHLDRSSIGRLAAERFGGAFVNGYYCEVSDYEPPEMEITIGKPPRNEFLILLGETEKAAQWYALPYIGNMDNMEVFGFWSPLPNIEKADDLSRLNVLAEKVSALDNAELVKLKAVMELGEIENVEEVIEIIDNLSEYDFDTNLRDESEFCRKYLQELLPQDFNTGVLEAANLMDFGSRILEAKGGMATSYGIISGQGQELYTPIYTEQEQTEDETESEEMGACLT